VQSSIGLALIFTVLGEASANEIVKNKMRKLRKEEIVLKATSSGTKPERLKINTTPAAVRDA